MRIKQIILLFAGVILVASLFYFGKTIEPVKTEAIMPAMPGAMQASSNNTVDFEAILPKAKKILTASALDSIEVLEQLLKQVRGETEKSSMLNRIGASWERTGNILVAGSYYMKEYEITGDINTLKKAADLFYTGFPTTTDSSAKVFGAQEGAKAFAQLAKEDSNQLDYQVKEAICNIDGFGNIMAGVVLLKGVERKDSTNEQMNLILGRLAVVSGQYDKATVRLEKLTKSHPENAEAWFHLAEAYRATGNKSGAIKALEQCKKLVDDPAFAKQIDDYIIQFKNQ